MDKQDDIVGVGMSASNKVDVEAIYSYDATGAPAETAYVSEDLQEELDSIAKPPRHESKLLRNLMIITAILAVALIFGWQFVAKALNTPFDFGPLTAVCLFLLVFFAYNIFRLAQHIQKMITEHSKASLIYHLIMPVLSLAVLLLAGYFEFKHQAVQFITTPAVCEISGEPTAIVRCDRVVRNLLDRAGGAWGYVYPGEVEAHLHPNVCNDIYDWYFRQDKAASSSSQIFALHTPLHEAEHVGGIGDELIAECTSLEWTEDIMLDLGASPTEARRIAVESREQQQNRNSSGSVAQQKLAQYEGDCSSVPLQRSNSAQK